MPAERDHHLGGEKRRGGREDSEKEKEREGERRGGREDREREREKEGGRE